MLDTCPAVVNCCALVMQDGSVIELADATESDFEQCLGIRAAALKDQAPTCYNEQQVASLLARDETAGMAEMIRDGQLLVARIEGIIVGCGGWRGANVYNLYVDPPVMRQGIGSALLVAIEEQFAAKTKNDTLYIDAGLYAEQFYVSCGYKVIQRATSSDGLRYLEMSKRLQKIDRTRAT